MTFEKDCLSDYVEFKQPCVMNLEENRSILAYGKGNYPSMLSYSKWKLVA